MTEKQEQEQELDKLLQEQIDNLSLNIQGVSVPEQGTSEQVKEIKEQGVQGTSEQVKEIKEQGVQEQGVQEQVASEQHEEIKEPGINPMIESELKKTLSGFFNEIDLVFDYVNKSIVQRLYKFLKDLDNSENVRKMVTNTLPILKKYETEISHVVTTRNKIRTNDLEFLNNIILFDDILDFKVFSEENKNKDFEMYNTP
jgi:hypothetical protein